MTIRVLIIDGSATAPIMVTRLEGRHGIEVVATARDSIQARELLRSLDVHVVALDVETEEIGGMDLLGKVMRLRPMPVIVVVDVEGAPAAVQALALGAIGHYAKFRDGDLGHDDGGRLAQLVREAARGAPRARGGPSSIG